MVELRLRNIDKRLQSCYNYPESSGKQGQPVKRFRRLFPEYTYWQISIGESFSKQRRDTMATITASAVALRELYKGEKIVFRATDGTATFAKSKKYTGYLDPDFKNWGLDVPGKPAPETPATMYEMDENGANGTFVDIFGSLGVDLVKLRVAQAQAESFAPDNRDKLHPEGWATWSLFTKGDEPILPDRSNLFVAYARVRDRRLKADVYEFSRATTSGAPRTAAASWFRRNSSSVASFPHHNRFSTLQNEDRTEGGFHFVSLILFPFDPYFFNFAILSM